jgi:hypothetical protein
MTLELVFNGRSLETPAVDRRAARLLMSGLVGVLRAAPDHGFGKGIRTSAEFSALQLAPNYTIQNWTVDRDAHRDERVFILHVATRCPFLVGVAPKIQEREHLVHCIIDFRSGMCLI